MLLAVLFGVWVLLIVLFRLYVVLPPRDSVVFPSRKRAAPCTTLIVLGSGGHTAEMFRLLRSMSLARYSPRTYVASETDVMCEAKVAHFEGEAKGAAKPPFELRRIPRSREVGQSYLTSVWTTVHATLACLRLVWSTRPDLVLCNGPGTCVPVVLAAYFFRYFGVKHTKVVYVESICRVDSLSLTGKLLYRLADALLVQWPQLLEEHPRAVYLGRIV